MDGAVRRTVVVSGVNLRKGGTLTIMRGALAHLGGLVASGEPLRVVALVHDRKLYDVPGIEFMELPWCTRSWFHRLWAEYVTMHGISRRIAAEDGRKVWLWLSMHDTTPRVEAEHQEVYCHTSFPFLKLRFRDFVMDPKIPLFAMFTRFAYKVNVRRNDSLIVQQEWFADALSRMLRVPREKFRVIPPVMGDTGVEPAEIRSDVPMFLYPSTADCHKNFETLCRAAALLEKQVGTGKFKVVLTVRGDENRYAEWLDKNWGPVESIDFHGFMSKAELFGHYRAAACLVFPSRVETWGLPISEFASTGNGRMLLADLPYAHESSAGASSVRYFNPDDAESLKNLMSDVLGECSEKI